MLRWLVVFTALLVFLGVWGSAALAQTPSPAPSPTPSGAFKSLSPGNQKIARALFEAQNTGSGGTTTTTKPLTLDEIAAKKQSGQGWGNVFKDMKAQGLVQEKNLGQIVSRQHRAGTGTVVTASGREVRDGHDGAGRSGRRDDDGSERLGYGKHEGKYESGSPGRGHTYASGSSTSSSSQAGAGRSGSVASGHAGRGSK